MRTHPHAEATYQVVPMSGGTFGVKVMIPDTYPTTVGSFATEAEAEAWIEQSQRRVASESESGKWFRRASDGPQRR